jgi:hypothetical protein
MICKCLIYSVIGDRIAFLENGSLRVPKPQVACSSQAGDTI